MIDRRYFLAMISGGIVTTAVKLKGVSELGEYFNNKEKTPLMPTIFIGHGSPMNAIADNEFTRSLSLLGKKLERPKAILCVSAHWMTEGTWITHMERPKTIHDFYGFPQPLFDIQYKAPGSPELAKDIRQEIMKAKIQLDDSWGLDHGTWSVLKYLYPNADIPVMQLSLDMSKPAEYHFQLGQELAKLRESGILILASGNIVHNLRKISWDENADPLDWAIEFDELVKKKLIDRNFSALQHDFLKTEAGRLSVPTLDHYLPLLYVIGASRSSDKLKFEYEEIQNASISMRAFSFGRV